MSWNIRFFQTERGDSPVLDFIEEQETSTQAKITHVIELLEQYGYQLKPPYVKKIHDNLYELRITGKVAIRIFYALCKNEYHLLHIFKKKTQKLPTREMQTALDRLKEII